MLLPSSSGGDSRLAPDIWAEVPGRVFRPLEERVPARALRRPRMHYHQAKEDRSMPLNAQAQALLEEMSKQGLPPFEQMSPTFARVVAMSFRDLQGEQENV